MEDWRTPAISKAEEKSEAHRETRTLRSWPLAILAAVSEAVAVIGALMVFTDSVEAKAAAIGIAAAWMMTALIAVGENVYRRWRVRADILTTRLVRANQEYGQLEARLPQPPQPQISIVEGRDRWALEVENKGGPADFVGRIEIIACSVGNEGIGRPLRWNSTTSSTGTVDKVRLLPSQVVQVVIGTIVKHSRQLHWWLHSGFTVGPDSRWTGSEEGPPRSPDLVELFHPGYAETEVVPTALIRITIATEPAPMRGVVVRYFMFDIDGLHPVSGDAP
jgi:hypothetical protein